MSFFQALLGSRWAAPIATAILLASGTAQAQFQERTIRASFTLTKEHALGQGLLMVQQCVAQKSGGKMKIEPYWSASLGPDAPAIQQLRSGTLDMVVSQTSFMTAMIPMAGVFDLPFLVANEREGDLLADGKAGELLSSKLAGVGLVNLAYWETGFRHVTNSKRPIQKMEDLQGLKLRILQNAVMVEAFKNLGSFAIPMPFPELYSALETKAVDGQENPVNITEQTKFYEVQKYMSLTRHMYNIAMVLYSKRLFDQLAPVEQAALRDCAVQTREAQRRISRQQVGESIARLKSHGMQINEVSDAELQRMREKSASLYASQAPVIGEEMMNLVNDELRRARTR
ncbi:DctP family TRAP transporter solute-binding subunit [Hydrogenophaga sp.]|uniref:DctP family TRAP transporter solute-binding subunit n=1 Tax=Hydrogenophaga sp. TaxID=1904254 RepID=UPI0026353630|nr:DctP family TRAP transporter solute-binding subunit [Hydrogenophaga sp.]MCW5653168.1 DctP family TRAP transporter solute-binding subunit [Hydrogenophaga sp.]